MIESAKRQHLFNQRTPLLFIDEIHRFNKSQQDSLLGAVEQGIVTLIGATTENPSFEVISPLLSRCQVYTLTPMGDEDLQRLLDRALTTDAELQKREIEVRETAALFKFSGNADALPVPLLVVVKFRGDIDAVNAAVDSAVDAATRVSGVVSHHVIANVEEDTEKMLKISGFDKN